MTNNDEQWMTIAEAADALSVSLRQCYRFVESGRLPTQKLGRRQMIKWTDIDSLASELGISRRPPKPPQQRIEVVQQSESELAQLVREMQEALRLAHLQIGELRAEVNHRMLPDQVREVERRAEDWEARAKALEKQLEAMRRQGPWWRRLFG